METGKNTDSSTTKWSRRSVIIGTLGFLLAGFTAYSLYMSNLPDIDVYQRYYTDREGVPLHSIHIENRGGGCRKLDCRAKAYFSMMYAKYRIAKGFLYTPVKDYYNQPWMTGSAKGRICSIEAKYAMAVRVMQAASQIARQTEGTGIRLEPFPVAFLKISYQDIFGRTHTQYFRSGFDSRMYACPAPPFWERSDAVLLPFLPMMDIEMFTADNLIKNYLAFSFGLPAN